MRAVRAVRAVGAEGGGGWAYPEPVKHCFSWEARWRGGGGGVGGGR